MTEDVGDPLPVRLVGAADVHVAVARVERLVRRGQDVRGTERPRRLPGREVARRVPVRLLQRGLEQRRVDELAAPGLQPMRVRRHDAQRGEDAGVDVGHRIAGLGGRAPGFARDGHQARESLRDEVEAALVRFGAVAAEPGHRAIDERLVLRGEHVVAEAQLVHRVAAEVLDEHVGGAHHPQQDRAAFGTLQIERDPALAAVHHQERRGNAVDTRLAVAARIVAARQLLDLDHVGAQVGEHDAARRPRHDLRELQHAHAGERTRTPAFAGRRGHAHRPLKRGFCFARNAA